MSPRTPSNFNSDIHTVHYADEYRKSVIDHRTFMNDSGREQESLDGVWHFSIDQYDTLLRAHWFRDERKDAHGTPRPPDYDWEHWQEVHVPSCWNMSAPEYRYYEGAAIYTRTFSYRPRSGKVPAGQVAEAGGGAAPGAGASAQASERVFLKVGAANYECFLFLNRRCIGVHRGGSTPFFIEVTQDLAEENRLTIVVNNRRERDQVPMDNTDWFNYGGVYRSIALIRAPEQFIRRWSVALAPKSNFGRIRVAVEADVRAPSAGATIRIPALQVERSFALTASGLGRVEIEAHPSLWSPESPVLYDVEIALDSGDIVRDRIGFREISYEGEKVLLNGRPIYLKGVSCHEDSLEHGKSLTSDEIQAMFDVASDLGCNFVRLAHYPHSEEVARMADERGVLLWEEVPVYWAIDFANERTYADAENQLSELILRDRNRASVILWSVGNENPDSDERLKFMSRLAERARSLDPTRLVTAACLWNRAEGRIADRLAEHLDVIGINEYYGWYEGNFEDLAAFFRNSKPGKPVVVSEFGAGALAGHYGTVDDLFSENRQAETYERQIEVIGSAPFVAGMTPWVLFDFRSPRRLNDYQRGFNRKGLVAADRATRKMAFFTLQAYYRSR